LLENCNVDSKPVLLSIALVVVVVVKQRERERKVSVTENGKTV